MAESLREQQKRLARLRILEAAASEIAERGPNAVSMADVARRAGVSLRTAYNYFADHDALVDAVAEQARDRFVKLGAIDAEPDLDRLPDMLRTNWRILDAMGVAGVALARIDAEGAPGSRRRRRGQTELTTTLRAALTDAFPQLASDELDAVAATFRAVVDVRAWHRHGDRLGRSGEVAAWTVETVIAALREGRGPFDAL